MTGHVVPPSTYLKVFVLLLVLLALTVAAAQIENPILNITVAIIIATSKAILIMLYFMHVRFSSPLTRVVALAGFLWLVILLGLTVSDFATRRWEREPERNDAERVTSRQRPAPESQSAIA